MDIKISANIANQPTRKEEPARKNEVSGPNFLGIMSRQVGVDKRVLASHDINYAGIHSQRQLSEDIFNVDEEEVMLEIINKKVKAIENLFKQKK